MVLAPLGAASKVIAIKIIPTAVQMKRTPTSFRVQVLSTYESNIYSTTVGNFVSVKDVKPNFVDTDKPTRDEQT